MEKSRTISNPMNNVFDLNKIIKWALPLVACLVLAVVAVTVLPGLKKPTEDFSGVEGEVVKTEPLSFVDGAHLDTIMCFEEQYLRISWTVNDTTYCLSNFDGSTVAELTAALEGVSCGR